MKNIKINTLEKVSKDLNDKLDRELERMEKHTETICKLKLKNKPTTKKNK